MKYFDICVNLLHHQFDADRLQTLQRAREQQVEPIVTACNLLESVQAIEFCREQGLRCTAGVHPHDAADLQGPWTEKLSALLANPLVCAAGEMGLDFNRNFSPPDVQRRVFRTQLELATDHGLSLFVHDRDSNCEVLNILTAAAPLPPTIVHCFTGTEYELRAYIEAGFYIGITGWIADPERGAQLRRLVSLIPPAQLLIETDAPFLKPANAPAEFTRRHGLGSRYKRRNEPALLPYVCEAVAAWRDETAEQLARLTHDNAIAAFQLTSR